MPLARHWHSVNLNASGFLTLNLNLNSVSPSQATSTSTVTAQDRSDAGLSYHDMISLNQGLKRTGPGPPRPWRSDRLAGPGNSTLFKCQVTAPGVYSPSQAADSVIIGL